MQSLVTMGLLPFLAVVAFFHDVKSLPIGKQEFGLYVVIFLASFSTAFYYVGYEEFTRSLRSLFGAVMAGYLVIGLTKDKDYGIFFHIGYIFSILILFGIMYIDGNIDLANFASEIQYRDRFMLNANAYSYFCYFANFSLFYLYIKWKNKFMTTLLLTFPLLFIVIAFSTQSRAGLILIILLNLCFWFLINKGSTQNKLKLLFRNLTMVILIFLIFLKFLDIYENSKIKSRIAVSEFQEDSREVLIKEGLVIFAENPILGVGLGQFIFYSSIGQFSHNSFVEILAEQGIFVGILLFTLFIWPILKSIRNLRMKPSDELLRCHVLFFVTFLIYNNAYVFYKFPFSMMYFFLIVTMQNKAAFVTK